MRGMHKEDTQKQPIDRKVQSRTVDSQPEKSSCVSSAGESGEHSKGDDSEVQHE